MSAQIASAVPVLFERNFTAGNITGDFYIDYIDQSALLTRQQAQDQAAGLSFTVGGVTVNGSLLAIRNFRMVSFASNIAQQTSATFLGWVDGDRGSVTSGAASTTYSFNAASGGGSTNFTDAFITVFGGNTAAESGIGIARGANTFTEVTRRDPSAPLRSYWVQYIVPAPVPVPASMPMMAAGLGALVFMARRKKKAKTV